MGKAKNLACAACRVQRKKCSEECVLAPHFPADDPEKFAVVQRVYGTSNVIKLLQGLETEQRAEAVNSLVSEATARVKDPIHGRTSVVHELQKQINELESQLATKREELMNMRSEYDKLVFLLLNGSPDFQDVHLTDLTEEILYEDMDPLVLWEPMDV
ncbi:hypothetical protein SUGI_0679180 [Cryptomeria japonica]|nr:hypothetical protein SUGI_0679180 [Cryptomeria japonica]